MFSSWSSSGPRRFSVSSSSSAEIRGFSRRPSSPQSPISEIYDENPNKLRPILPCYRDAFVALDRSVDGDGKLPENGFIPKPKNGDVVNYCNFQDRGQRPDRGPQTGSGDSKPEPEPEPRPEGCTITGTRRDDTLQGTDRRDVICGKGGDDTIRGLGGDDTLRGGSGSDTTHGDDGDDTVEDGRGRDTLGGEAGNDRFDARDGVRGNDTVNGGSGRDTCRADRGDTVTSCS